MRGGNTKVYFFTFTIVLPLVFYCYLYPQKTMEKIQYRFVYNRKKQLNGKGEALVQIEALLHRKKTYYSTHIHLEPRCWDKRRQKVINHPFADDLNAMLYEEKNRMEGIEIAEWKRSGNISLGVLKKLVKGNVEVGNFIQFAKEVIEKSQRSKGTKGNMMTTLKRLAKFRPNIEFRDLTFTFVREFEQYLSGEHTNTTAKHLKNLRTMINAAINEGYMKADDYPFRKFRIKTVEAKHEFLSPDELKMVESLPRCKILDAFLFCCYTGMRFSDFIHMTKDNIRVIDGERWLCFRTRKTNTELKLPLHLLFDGKALEILDRYKVSDLVNIGCNADANKELRKVLPPMNKKVTWHTARHTCATILIYNRIPVTTVQKLLGHANVKTTMIYAEILSTTIVKDLSELAKNKE